MFGHCFTVEHPLLVVLYGIRITDGSTMVRPIVPRQEWANLEVGVTKFLDACGSFCLLLYPPANILLVYNPLEPLRHHVAFPEEMFLEEMFPQNLPADPQRLIVNVYNVYSSVVGNWVAFGLEYVSQDSLRHRNLNTSISLVVDDLLYTVYLPHGVLGGAFFYTVANVAIRYPRTVHFGN
ncbi:hypothetical protein Tco_1503621 [Tanacetum coccineum]